MKKFNLLGTCFLSLIPCILVLNENEDELWINVLGIIWSVGLYFFYKKTARGREIVKFLQELVNDSKEEEFK